jgi:methylmalonyl-CoA epimerase
MYNGSRDGRFTQSVCQQHRAICTLIHELGDIAAGLPIEVVKIDHVAMATWDARGPAHLLANVLGATFVDGGDEPHAGFRWLQFQLPGGKIEVLEPLDRDGFLYKFLTRRGEGLHHVTLYVADLADAIPKLTSAGYTPVDVNLSHAEWKEAFLHPRETPGVLIQLAQVSDPNAPYEPPKELEEFLEAHIDFKP